LVIDNEVVAEVRNDKDDSAGSNIYVTDEESYDPDEDDQIDDDDNLFLYQNEGLSD
jgi:hypothetical protein